MSRTVAKALGYELCHRGCHCSAPAGTPRWLTAWAAFEDAVADKLFGPAAAH